MDGDRANIKVIPLSCVHSGWCCTKGPCPTGLGMGFEAREPCPKLTTMPDGRHLCGIVLEAETEDERDRILNKVLKVGRGCSSPLSPNRIARIPKASFQIEP